MVVYCEKREKYTCGMAVVVVGVNVNMREVFWKMSVVSQLVCFFLSWRGDSQCE